MDSSSIAESSFLWESSFNVNATATFADVNATFTFAFEIVNATESDIMTNLSSWSTPTTWISLNQSNASSTGTEYASKTFSGSFYATETSADTNSTSKVSVSPTSSTEFLQNSTQKETSFTTSHQSQNDQLSSINAVGTVATSSGMKSLPAESTSLLSYPETQIGNRSTQFIMTVSSIHLNGTVTTSYFHDTTLSLKKSSTVTAVYTTAGFSTRDDIESNDTIELNQTTSSLLTKTSSVVVTSTILYVAPVVTFPSPVSTSTSKTETATQTISASDRLSTSMMLMILVVFIYE